MIATGHNARAAQIVEQIKKRHTQTIEKHQTERLPGEFIERLERLEKLLNDFGSSQEFVLPKAFAEMVERVRELEARPVEVMPAEPAELKGEVETLGQELAEMSGAVLTHISALLRRVQALEQRFADLPIELAQLQAERRRG